MGLNYVKSQDAVKNSLALVRLAALLSWLRQLEALENSKLIENIVRVVFNCLLADNESRADFLVAVTLDNV